MNELQQKLLGGYAAVRINNLDEFNKVVGFLAIKNCFLANNETVKRMKYPGTSTFVLYRADDGFIWWSPIADIDTKKYQLIDVKDLGLEQIDDQIILEANAVVVEEIKELTEENMTLVVMTKPEHVAIPSNIDELVALIPAIEAKANVVVDENNYKTFIAKGSGTVPLLRKYAKNLKDEKKKIKDAYMQSFDEFSNNVDKVINALEITAKKIDDEVKHFIDQQKESLRKEREIEINKLKEVLIENKMISKEYADKFNFDEKWLNASCSTKRFKEEVEAQFNSLIEKEKLDKQDAQMIENTIVNTCTVAGVDEKLVNKTKYLLLLQQGTNLGDITKMITDEVNALKQQKEALLEQQKREAQLKQQKKDEQTKTFENQTYHGLSGDFSIKQEKSNDQIFKRGDEVIGKTNGNYIITEIKHVNDEKFKGKTWTKTFEFTGDLASLQMLNRYMEILKKFNNTFDFKEVK